jgi:membrane fusion protein, adhesin transport system
MIEAQINEIAANKAALTMRYERLRAFAENRQPQFDIVGNEYRTLAENELTTFTQQAAALSDEREVISFQRQQKLDEIQILQHKSASLKQREKILREQKEMRETLMKQGLVSKLVYLTTLDQYQSVAGEIAEISAQIERGRNAATETEVRLAQLSSSRRSEALIEASKVAADIAALSEQEARLNDRYQRLDIRAPIGGLVKGLTTRTPGSVIAPGGKLTDIVPTDEEMLFEARISPTDIGHIRQGQAAQIRLATFDHARFGPLLAEVQQLSATTFNDPDQRPYYKAQIKLQQTHVGPLSDAFYVLPGMTGQVSIITGERTIMRYLLRPVFQSLDYAFRER